MNQLPAVGTYSELSNLDYALTKDGDRVALYQIDRGQESPIFRVWTRLDDKAVDYYYFRSNAQAAFHDAVALRGGRI